MRPQRTPRPGPPDCEGYCPRLHGDYQVNSHEILGEALPLQKDREGEARASWGREIRLDGTKVEWHRGGSLLLWVIGTFVGIELVFNGCTWVMLALALRNSRVTA